MRQMLRLTATIAALLWLGFASAQTRVIQGTVKDESGKSVPFMAVQVKGTTIGTYTDTAGKFTMAVDSSAKTLMLSYPGMKNQEIAISDNMLITMKNDALGLDEVVVVAIGIPVEKKQLGYATQTVNSDQLNNSGTSNALNELDGKVAGLQVISSSGDPGAGTYIDLRGPTALTGNNQPLMIVDGVPIDNSINAYDPQLGFLGGITAGGASGALYGSTQPTNRGLDINPSDIESITVLKGPAATALYGIEAANGALIITTKKGGKGKEPGMGIDFNSSESWSTYNKLPAMQNDYAQGTWTDATGSVPSSATYFGPQTGMPYSWGPAINTLAYDGIPTAYDSHGSIVPKAPGLAPAQAYNPYDFFQTGVAADNNISFSGGNDKSGFRMSLGNLEQTGIVPTSKYDKTTFNINGQTALSKKFSISAGINYTNSINDKVQQGSNTSGVMLGLLRTPPTFDNSNGNGKNAVNTPSTYILPNDSERDFRGGPGYDNPYWTVNENPYIETVNRLFGFGQLSYQMTDWMTLNWHFGGDAYVQDDKNVIAPYSSTNFPSGDAYLIDYINEQFNSDVTLNINKKLSEAFNLNVILGQNYFDNSSDMRITQGSGLTLPYFLDMSNATSFVSHESEGIIHRSAWYGQAIIGFKSQLFLTITGRDETTSTLAANNDNFFYPSVDLGWVFTEPLHLSTNKFFSFGKLRLSYAQVGQDAPSQALQTYYSPAAVVDGFTSGVSFPFNGAPGFQISTPNNVMGNPNLLPQKTSSYEVGADLAFFQNRISVNFTYYSEETTDEILAVPIPLSSGFGYEEANLGEVTNKGAELTINTTPVKMKNFEWDLGVNWSKNVNEVVQLAPGVKSLYVGGFNQYDVPGQPSDEIFGTDFVRIPGTLYNPSSPMANLVLSDAPGPGYGLPIVGATNQPLANAQPSWIGGATTSFTFKSASCGNFTLSAVVSIREGGWMWDGTYGAMQYYGTAQMTDNRGSTYTVPSGAEWGHLNAAGQIVHYTSPNKTVSSGPEITGAGSAVSQKLDSNIYSQYYYQNVDNAFTGPISSDIFSASYIRISQISFTYELPKRMVQKAHFVRMSITLFANNPFLWTSYPGVDPETNLGGPANAQGADYFNAPNTKSYGVRLNLGL
jgi:TonB-linked SusC/RagA family outer membrane protein